MAVINVGGLPMTALLLTALLWHAGLPTGATRAQTGPEPARPQPPAVSPPFQPEVPGPLLEPVRLTRRAFEMGAGTSQDLVVSAAAPRRAELNRVVSEFQLFQARSEAFLAEAACDG